MQRLSAWRVDDSRPVSDCWLSQPFTVGQFLEHAPINAAKIGNDSRSERKKSSRYENATDNDRVQMPRTFARNCQQNKAARQKQCRSKERNAKSAGPAPTKLFCRIGLRGGSYRSIRNFVASWRCFACWDAV